MQFRFLRFTTKGIVALFALFLFSTTNYAQNCNQTLVHYDLDACASDDSYDEYTADTDFGPNATGSASIFSNMGHHSCTPGAAGNAMCHAIMDGCDFMPDNPNAYRFTVEVNPAAGFKTTISGLSFFEAAPLSYLWLTGQTGDNDPPSKYGIRVLRDGAEIYRMVDVATSESWSLEEFDFSGMEFMADQPATFTFELLGYCRQVNSPRGFAVWDVDEIKVHGCVESTDPCDQFGGSVSGGTLTGGPFNFCVDGTPDNIPANGIVLSGNTGSNNRWVVTDDMGNILGLPPTFTAPDFDAAGVGVCFVYNLSFEGTVTGLTGGANINDFQGCFELSNGIEVVREICNNPPPPPTPCNRVNGGSLVGGPFNFCVDGTPDNIPANGITLSGNSGPISAWVITDDSGNILGLPPSFTAPNFDAAGVGVCIVYNVTYEAGLTGLAGGANINNLQGCFAISNGIQVVREICNNPPPPPPPGGPGCDANYTVNGNEICATGLNDPFNSFKVLDMNGGIIYSCNNFMGGAGCGTSNCFTVPADGKYFVQIQTFDPNFTMICNIWQEVIIGTLPPNPFDCIINASVTNVQCDGVNTFSFDVTANIVNGGAWGWDIAGTNIMMIPSGTTVTVSGNPMGNGTTTFTVFDHDKPSCTTTISVNDPAGPCTGTLTAPTNSTSCDAEIFATGNEILVSGLNNPHYGVKVIDGSWNVIFECTSWDNTCDGTEAEIILSEAGTYYISVVSHTDSWVPLCRLFEKVEVIDNQGLEVPSNADINIFPNPAENNLNLRLMDLNTSGIDVLILNQVGGVVKSYQFDQIGNEIFDLNIEGLKNGVYTVVVLSQDNNPITKRLVVGKSYYSKSLGH